MRILMAWLGLFAGVAGAAPPLEVKGLSPGSSLEQFMEALPYAQCLTFASDLSDEVCRATDRTFAGVKVSYTGFAIKGYLESIHVNFASADHRVIEAALVEKFGPAAKRVPMASCMRAAIVASSMRH